MSKLYMLGMLSITLISNAGCSYFSKTPKKMDSTVNKLSYPPTLTKPKPTSVAINTAKKTQRKPIVTTPTPTINPNKSYYIIVGTYPSNDQALDMFIKMSSLGFTNTAMETRMTKQGTSLHMVRLGPFNKQNNIDKTKDTLKNAGVTQFRLVEN